MPKTAMRMFRYRLYPTKSQERVLNKHISILCSVYNHLLETKIKAYKRNKKSLGKFDLNNAIVKLKRKNPELKIVHSQSLQNVSDRIDKAFKAFFRRVKKHKEDAGFPRFKSFRKYKSITFPQSGFDLVDSDRKVRIQGEAIASPVTENFRRKVLRVSKLGDVKIVYHRPIDGKPKTFTIKRMPSGKWFAIFSCEIPLQLIKNKPTRRSVASPVQANSRSSPCKGKIGLDIGLENFATTSDGVRFENPRFLVASEAKLAKLQRRLSKKVKGSANRNKARLKVARLHEKIFNQRNDFQHKLSNYFVHKYGTVAIEDLNVLNMCMHPFLAKHIHDASWSRFAQMLEYKAESAGSRVVRVNPRGTSQKCSRCGNKTPKSLAIRWHRCVNCGLQLHRDHNASLNILSLAKAGRVGTTQTNASGDETSTPFEQVSSSKEEATGLVRR